MHPVVREAWHSFSEPLEGRILSMYLDTKGLVTCGVGNLIDPVSEALKLPWKKQHTGELATATEVRAAWDLLKSHQEYSKKSTASALALTGLVLTDADVDRLVDAKLSENEQYLTQKYFAQFPEWPADAQLGVLSMAWACGPGFPEEFKNFRRAAAAGDWYLARAACTIREQGNPGIVPRNKANRVCFENAAIVSGKSADVSVLYWPRTATHPLSVPAVGVVPDQDQKDAEIRALATEAAITSTHDLLLADRNRQHRAEMDTIDEEPESDVDPEGENQS